MLPIIWLQWQKDASIEMKHGTWVVEIDRVILRQKNSITFEKV